MFMQQAEADEPGSIEYNYQVWRQQRNEIVNVETEHQAPIADSCRWDRSVATIQTASYPLTIAFHSYDQHVVIANDKDTIRYAVRMCLGRHHAHIHQRLGLVQAKAAMSLLQRQPAGDEHHRT